MPGDGQPPQELEEAAQALSAGQCSGILESDEGFSILRRLAPETKDLADDYFDERLQEAASAARVVLTENYDGLDTESFYTALEALRAGEKGD